MADNSELNLLAPGALEEVKQAYASVKDLGDLIVEVNGKLKAGEGAILSASKVSDTNKAIESQVLSMRELAAIEKDLQREANNYIKLQVKLEKQAEARAKAEQKAAENIIKATQAKEKADEQYQKQIEKTAAANERRLLAIQKATEKEVQAVFDAENAYKRLETVVKMNTEEGKRLAAQYGLMSSQFLQHEAATAKYRVQLAKIDGALGDGRKNVGNYASSMMELTQVVRELPSAANGLPIFLQAIGNNLPQLQQKFSEVRKEASSTGKALGIFATSLFSMSNIFTLAMSAIIIGVSYFSRYSKETKEATKEVNEFEKAQKELSQTVGKEIGQLQTLAATAANTSLSYKERGDAVDKLQKQYPEYFGNLEREKILNGEVANEINKATDAIMKNARTKALQSKLEKEYAGLIEAQLELQKLQNNDQNTFNYAGEERIKYLKDEANFRQSNIDQINKQIQLEKGYAGDVVYFLDERSRKEYEALRAKDKANALLTEKERKELDKRAKDYEEYLKKIEQAKENIRNIAKSTNRPNPADITDETSRTGLNFGNVVTDALVKTKGEAMQRELAAQTERFNATLNGIDQSFLNGLYKNTAEYEKAKADAVNNGARERFEIEKKYLQAIIDLLPLDSKKRQEYQEKLSKVERDLYQELVNDKLKADKAAERGEERSFDKRLKNIQKFAQKAYQAVEGIFSGIGDAINTQTEARLSELDAEKTKIEENAQYELNKIEQSKLSEEEKQAAIQYAQGQTANQRKRIEFEEAQQKQRQARFDKAANIARIIGQTALAVISALADTTLPYPAKVAAAIASGAAGAVQLATAIAAPIPQYAKGTDKHKGGVFIAGDGGERELVQHPDGTAYWTGDNPAVYSAPVGTRVIPESKLASSVANLGMSNIMRRQQTGQVFDTRNLERAINRMNTTVNNHIEVHTDNLKIRVSRR